jgi:hypothetical protein
MATLKKGKGWNVKFCLRKHFFVFKVYDEIYHFGKFRFSKQKNSSRRPTLERERERERERPLVESLMVTTEGREFNASPISLPPTTLLSYPIGTGWPSGNGRANQGRI